jgi:hypothetical protein
MTYAEQHEKERRLFYGEAIRKSTYKVPQDADPEEVYDFWRETQVPKDASDAEVTEFLTEKHGEFKPKIPWGERFQQAGEIMKSVPGAVAGAVGEMVTAPVQAGAALGDLQIAQDQLKAAVKEGPLQGETQKQFGTRVRGLQGEITSLRPEFAGKLAETAATAITLPVAGPAMLVRPVLAAGAKMGVKAVAKHLAGGAGKQALFGAGATAAYGGIKGGVEAAFEQRSIGEIYQETMKGVLDPQSLIIGGLVGGALGVGGAGLGVRKGAQQVSADIAGALAKKADAAAQSASLTTFVKEFVPDPTRRQGLDPIEEALALIEAKYGPALASTKEGMQAAKELSEKLAAGPARIPMAATIDDVIPEGAPRLGPEPNLPPAVQGLTSEAAPTFKPPGDVPPVPGLEQAAPSTLAPEPPAPLLEGPKAALEISGTPAEQTALQAALAAPGPPPAEGLATKTGAWAAPASKRLTQAATAAETRIKARAGSKRGVKAFLKEESGEMNPSALSDHATVLASQMFHAGLKGAEAAEKWLVAQHGDWIKPHVAAIVAQAEKVIGHLFKDEGNMARTLGKLQGLRSSGRHGMDWYEMTSKWAKETVGDDSEMFLKFLAVTSADSSTEAGGALALKAFSQWRHGLPFTGMRSESMTANLRKVAAGEAPGGDKIGNFMKALLGDPDAVVLDRWMIKALGMSIKQGSLPEKQYKLYAQIVKDMAVEAGMSPRQFQAAIWEGARIESLHKRFAEGGAKAASKVGSARPLEDLVRRKLGGKSIDEFVAASKLDLEKMDRLYTAMKPVRDGAKSGHTFDPHTFKEVKEPGYVVSLASENVGKAAFYPTGLLQFRNKWKRLLDGKEDFTIGIFRDETDGMMSFDLNIRVQDKARALAIGKKNRQRSIGHFDEAGEWDAGAGIPTGYNEKKHGPQFLPPAKNKAAWFKAQEARIRAYLSPQQALTLKGARHSNVPGDLIGDVLSNKSKTMSLWKNAIKNAPAKE